MQTTRECVYFQSRDKEGAHTIRSAIAENAMLHANFTVLSSIELELLKFYIAGIWNLAAFAAVTLTLTP